MVAVGVAGGTFLTEVLYMRWAVDSASESKIPFLAYPCCFNGKVNR